MATVLLGLVNMMLAFFFRKFKKPLNEFIANARLPLNAYLRIHRDLVHYRYCYCTCSLRLKRERKKEKTHRHSTNTLLRHTLVHTPGCNRQRNESERMELVSATPFFDIRMSFSAHGWELQLEPMRLPTAQERPEIRPRPRHLRQVSRSQPRLSRGSCPLH